MAKWTPTSDWAGEDAFIIGGGPSLIGYDFTKLTGRNVIGCNDAFRLGPAICSYVIFGDAGFFRDNMRAMETSGCQIVTNAPSLGFINVPWLLTMGRQRDGLHHGNVLGWNYSTGAAAVNLAVSLGANRIFLLGFDMGKRHDGKSHWHNHRSKAIHDSAYQRFIRGFQTLQKALKVCEDIEVFNVTDGTSKLPVFPRIPFSEFERELHGGGS